MEVTVDVQGFDGLDRQLAALGHDLGGKALRSAANKAMTPLQKDMKARAPVGKRTRIVKKKGGSKVTIEPGFLRSRIKKSSRLNKRGTRNGRWAKGDTARVRVGVRRAPYVGHVEFGTSDMPAEPFIRPAFQAKSQQVLDDFGRDIAANIKKYGAK